MKLYSFTMVNNTEFAERLQKILDFYGISATELSNQISFNRSTISHLLSGRNKPSLDFVMKVLEKFPEVELYWFLNGKGNFPSKKTKDPIDLKFEQNNAQKEALPKKEEVQELNPLNFPDTANQNDIDRIVIFFKDGSFKSFKN